MATESHPTWRPVSERAELDAAHWQPTDLPALGYPLSEQAISHWFEKTWRRKPEAAEVAVIQERMAQRAAAQPAAEGPTDRVFEDR